VRAPTLLGVGEDDPLFARLLDELDDPRYLPAGTGDGLRRIGTGVPDVAVLAGAEADYDGVELGAWSREWGLVVDPAGDIGALETLVDGEHRFVNRDSGSGLRGSFDAVLERFAAEREQSVADVTAAIDGYDLTTKAHESPARKVKGGEADAGLGLRATAETLDLGFVSLGTERVRVLANPDRTAKQSVRRLADLITDSSDVVATLPGYGT